jgi:hypothetical protein
MPLMKNLPLLCLTIIMLMAISCKKEAEKSSVTYPLHLHIQSDFEHDHVEVLINSTTVFDGIVTTNDIWGLSEEVELEQGKGPFLMKMIFNDSKPITRAIDMQQELYVGVGHDGWNDTLYIHPTIDPFLYD